MASVRTQIENAIVALLRDLETSRAVRTVRPYNGELAAEKSEEVMRALNGQLPGVLVATENGAYRGVQVQRRRYRRDFEIALYLVSGSTNTREERTRGANQIYDMEDAVLARLTGVKPALEEGVSVGHLEPVSEQVIGHDPVICVWKQSWRLTVEAELADRPAPVVTETQGRIGPPGAGPDEPVIRISTLIS